MANGKVVYPSSATSQTTYVFPRNYSFGHTEGYLETDDNARAIDGTLNSYTGPQKKTFTLSFHAVPRSQFDYFTALFLLQCPIDLYLNGTDLDAVVKMMAPPVGESLAAFIAGQETYSFEAVFEEV